jgi:hypothetical protein
LEKRKRREFDPAIVVVRQCVAEAKKSGAGDTYARECMQELLGFVVLMSAQFEEFGNLSPSAVKGMLKLRGGVREILRG